jgi:hypothetical protein
MRHALALQGASGLRFGRRRKAGSLGRRVICTLPKWTPGRRQRSHAPWKVMQVLRLIGLYSLTDGRGTPLALILYSATVGAVRAVAAQRGGRAAVLSVGAVGQPQRRLCVAVTRCAGGARGRHGRRARRFLALHRTLQKGTTGCLELAWGVHSVHPAPSALGRVCLEHARC